MASAEIEFHCFVRGLAWATNNKALERAFAAFGEIIESKPSIHMGGVQCAVENYINSMVELQTTMDNFQKTILAEVSRLVEYQSNWVPDGDSLRAHNGPWYAPDDPTLPQPWKGVIDGSSGSIYYWNIETNTTQYEKPKPDFFLPTDHHRCASAPHVPSTNYHHNSSLTHPTLPHPSHQIPPFPISAHPTHSDYGYLYPSPYLADQLHPYDPYPNTPPSSPCPSVNYPESPQPMLDNYAMPNSSLTPPPSYGAFTACGGFNIQKRVHSNASNLNLQLVTAHYHLKPRSPVSMKHKRQLTLSHRRPSPLSKGLKWEKWSACYKARSIVPTTKLVLPSDMLLDSISPPMVLDDIVKHDFNSPPCTDESMFTLGTKTIVTGTEGFAKFSEGNCSYPATDPSCQPHSLADESLTDLSNMPEEKEQSAIAHHSCHLVVDVDNFSKVTNLFSDLKPIWLSMSFIASSVCLEVSIPESYEPGSKQEAVEFDQFMVCSFTVIELKKTLRVAHLAHLQATLSDWNREKHVLSSSNGDFEYDVHLENFIESLMRNSQKLFVNIYGKGMESKCSVNYNWLPSLNWNQVLLISQGVNFQQGFSSLGNDIVLLNYNSCFFAVMHFLGLIASFVPTGLATFMLTFSHAWDLQIHKPWTRWITTVNTFTATLSHDLTTEGLMVVLGINSGTIDLASLMISNGHFAMIVTSCHLIGGAYSYNAWLYFLMIKNQGIHMILIAHESPVQRISLFLFARASKNRVIAFVLDLCNQEGSTGKKDKREALDDIGTKAVVMYAPLVVKNITELASLKHKKEALDDIGLGAFVFVSLVVFRHSHIAWEVRLTDVLEFPRDSMIENALATFWLCCVTSMSSLQEGWAPHLNGLMALWVKTLIGECMIILLPQCMNTMKVFHQLDDTSWKLVVSMHVKVALQEINIFYYFVQWAVSLVIIHFGYGLFPFLNECVVYSNADVANPTVIVCGAKDGHILPWKMATGNLDYFNFHDLLELDNEEVAHNALEWLIGLLRHDTHLYVGYLLDIPEIIVAWKNTKFGLVFYFNVSISVLDEDSATIRNALVSANSTTALRHAMWEVMLLFHGICYKAFPLSPFKLAPQQFYEAKLAKKVILDQATLLNVESAFFCSAEMESLCVKWFVGQVGTGADSQTSKWNCFSNKLRIHGCHDNLGGLHAGHEQYLIRSLVLDATTQTPLLVNPNDVVVKKGMLTLSSHKLLICALVMKENIVAVAAKYNTVRGKVIVDVVITLNQLPHGSYRYWNAQEAFVFPDDMLCESMNSTDNLINEGPSTVVFTQRLLGCNWRILAAILRHEDMPSLKGGGMIGSLGYGLALHNWDAYIVGSSTVIWLNV